MSIITQPHKKAKIDVSSEMIVANTLPFSEEVEIIRARLPTEMQNDSFAQSATYRVLSLQWTVNDFYKWLDLEIYADRQKADANARIAEANARTVEASTLALQITQKAKVIIEPEVRALVEDIFRTSFSMTCMFDTCESVITLAKFYVIRDDDVFYACCYICYRIEKKNGKPGEPKIAGKDRRLAWEHHNGNNAFGACYHCKEFGHKHQIHFYLDAWEAGHDIPQSKNGGNSIFNLAPLHVRCNNNQRTKTFAQYHSRQSETASATTQGDVPSQIGFPSDITMDGIEQEKQINRQAYDFFDCINVNSDGHFSVHDAVHAAYMLQHPDATYDEIQARVNSTSRNNRRILNKRQKIGDELVPSSSTKGYQPYQVIARLLLNRSDLTKFCDMMVALASREIAPCPVRLAASMLHLKDIADGSINVNVAFNILGLRDKLQQKTYVLEAKVFAEAKMTCMQVLEKRSGPQICGQRVMTGKTICSYHARKKRLNR